MDTSKQRQTRATLIKLGRVGLFAILALNLGACATMMANAVKTSRIKIGDQISCEKNRPATSQISADLCEQVNDKIQQEADLKQARVGFDLQGKGRLQLAGEYKNEDEVVRVFAIAQAMVGSDWVSPVKPGHIEVEAWQECLKNKVAGRECVSWDIEPYSLDNKPPGPVRNRHALVIGVGQFKHGIRKLHFAVNDAKLVADYLTNPRYGNFPSRNVTLLNDEQASSQAIQAGLADIEARAKKDDLVVVYISSHGAPPNVYGHVNIVTYDTEVLFGNKKQEELDTREKVLQRQALWDSSISRKRLHQFFVNLAAKGVKRTLMVLDVCYSGDALNEFPGFRPTANEGLAKWEESYTTGYSAEQLMQMVGAKDLVLEDSLDPGAQTKTAVAATKRLSASSAGKKRGSKSGTAWGQVIISASAEGEKSWEPNPNADLSTSNSYFTHYFIEKLKQTGGRVQDSFTASVPDVIQKVLQIAQKPQHPQSFAFPNPDHWNFPLRGRGN